MKKLILICLSFLVYAFFASKIFSSQEHAYNMGKNFGAKGVSLGNPAKTDSGISFLNLGADVSHLKKIKKKNPVVQSKADETLEAEMKKKMQKAKGEVQDLKNKGSNARSQEESLKDPGNKNIDLLDHSINVLSTQSRDASEVASQTQGDKSQAVKTQGGTSHDSKGAAAASGLFCPSAERFKRPVHDTKMAKSLSYLGLLKGMSKEMDPQSAKVFPGESSSCCKDMANFVDCCGTLGGWGETLNLTYCNGEEKMLAQRRRKGLCHKVGTYCKTKFLGICVREVTTFCCFPSKMARVFHEQGRRQLWRGWGSPKYPDCGALTSREISQINFEKMDLREIFEDLKVSPQQTQAFQKSFADQISKNMPQSQMELNERAEKAFGANP